MDKRIEDKIIETFFDHPNFQKLLIEFYKSLENESAPKNQETISILDKLIEKHAND